ncbi:dihydroorotase [Lapidilactobacillus bayanensis]|uniref:dihydroorotase n=1 Tax=Lapidilactobacillus bayanensis TaxID=2485998 RepID=UPI000F768FA2|nr:dihydroorotase [Lapidilactobacillus bayanensis]
MKTLLINGYVALPTEVIQADVLLDAGKISTIGQNLQDQINGADQVIDLAGQVLAPGLIDLHVHFRQPGFTDKETVRTGSLAAAHGGFTTVCAMPNLEPVPDNVEQFKKMLVLNHDDGVVHIKQYATITMNRVAGQLVDFQELKNAGAFGFSNDGSGIQTAKEMYDAMQAAQAVALPICAHVEDAALKGNGVMNAGPVADKLGLPGIPTISETAQLARDLVLAAETGVHYHVCHVSTAQSVDLIRRAKAAGVRVTAEVSPHHLFLDETMITYDNPMLKMNPPLRRPEDRQALLNGLLDGTIDLIATDHAPHTAAEKTGSMLTAAFGITGLETSFAECYTHLVRPGICTLTQLLQWMSLKPAQLFNLQGAGKIAVGQTADLVILNLAQPYEIKVEDMQSKGKNSPFIGEQVYGQVVMTIVAGKIVYQQHQASTTR